jgi:hypothetical protein
MRTLTNVQAGLGPSGAGAGSTCHLCCCKSDGVKKQRLIIVSCALLISAHVNCTALQCAMRFEMALRACMCTCESQLTCGYERSHATCAWIHQCWIVCFTGLRANVSFVLLLGVPDMADPANMEDYQIRRVLKGHTDDVSTISTSFVLM